MSHRSFLAALVTLLATLSLLPASAAAHVELVSATPGVQRQILVAPAELRLHYSEPPILRLARVSVIDSSGDDVAAGPPGFDSADHAAVVVALRPVRPGRYTVHWQMLSDDGHVIRGVYGFGFQQPAGPPQPAPGSGPGLASDALRWAYFLALSLAGGGLLFQVAVLDPVLRRRPPSTAGARTWRGALAVAAVAAVAALHLDLYAYTDWAHQVVGGGAGSFANAEIRALWSAAPIGRAWALTTVAWLAVVALIGAAALRPAARTPLAGAAAMLALGAGLGLSASGHAAATAGVVSVAVAADYLHLLGAAVWLGGVAALALIVWPAARGADDRDDGDAGLPVRACLARFSTLAVGAILVLVIAGAYLALTRLHGPGDLLSGYGVLLLSKSAIAIAALAVGAYHRTRLPRRFAAWRPGSRTGISTLRLELALLSATLLIAAVLTNTAPPA